MPWRCHSERSSSLTSTKVLTGRARQLGESGILRGGLGLQVKLRSDPSAGRGLGLNLAKGVGAGSAVDSMSESVTQS